MAIRKFISDTYSKVSDSFTLTLLVFLGSLTTLISFFIIMVVGDFSQGIFRTLLFGLTLLSTPLLKALIFNTK